MPIKRIFSASQLPPCSVTTSPLSASAQELFLVCWIFVHNFFIITKSSLALTLIIKYSLKSWTDIWQTDDDTWYLTRTAGILLWDESARESANDYEGAPHVWLEVIMMMIMIMIVIMIMIMWLWWRSTCFALGALSKLSPLTFTDYAFCVHSTHFGLTLNWTLQHNWTFSTGRRLSCGQCPRIFPSQCRCPGFTSPRFPMPSQFRCRNTFGNASNLDPTAPRIRCNLKGLKLRKILLLIEGAIWQRSRVWSKFTGNCFWAWRSRRTTGRWKIDSPFQSTCHQSYAKNTPPHPGGETQSEDAADFLAAATHL